MPHYRIADLLSDVIDPTPITVDAPTPEKAAELALGVSLTRSGARPNLRARVLRAVRSTHEHGAPL